ncbi:hypothetical protein BDN72DRAFT_297024 [Pluteus cervinus]|uniref:Uncharacterized protein n=1 Tax=Pluteus cervinus TaxID=181527 RepID=A0ACD3B4N4_9AGAR|nr:hypothetical protein BDN72DRAFT_297024 [Pluteus cervinus]
MLIIKVRPSIAMAKPRKQFRSRFFLLPNFLTPVGSTLLRHPDAIRNYVSSRDRTARWVTAHYNKASDFESPSIPHAELAGIVPSSPSSEAETTPSLPPRIVLRYSDGRPDVAVPPPDEYNLTRAATSSRRHGHEGSRDHTYHYDHRPRTGSHGAFSPNAFARRADFRELSPVVAPEEIRILPSHSGGTSHRSRSKSLSRGVSSSDPSSTTLSSPVSQSPEPIIHSKPVVISTPSHHSHTSHYSHAAHHHEYHTTKVPHGPRPSKHTHTQPTIIHPPAHHSRSHYQPPYYAHPPQVGPNGVVYSHSAPVPLTHPAHVHPVPFPTPAHYGPHHPKQRSRFESDPPRSQSAGGFRRRDGTIVDTAQDGAYYVFPTVQKVHVIVSIV